MSEVTAEPATKVTTTSPLLGDVIVGVPMPTRSDVLGVRNGKVSARNLDAFALENALNVEMEAAAAAAFHAPCNGAFSRCHV
jgi:hypothetical protein